MCFATECNREDLVVLVVAHMHQAAAACTYPSMMSSFSRISAAAPLYVYLEDVFYS